MSINISYLWLVLEQKPFLGERLKKKTAVTAEFLRFF